MLVAAIGACQFPERSLPDPSGVASATAGSVNIALVKTSGNQKGYPEFVGGRFTHVRGNQTFPTVGCVNIALVKTSGNQKGYPECWWQPLAPASSPSAPCQIPRAWLPPQLILLT